MAITPFGLARLHCANFESDSSCAGLDFDPATGLHVQAPLPKCVLEVSGVRCPYFESTVMLMGRADWPGLQTPAEHQAFAAAVKRYKLAANVGNANQVRNCPKCRQPLEPRRRLCHACAAKAKREANRNRRNGESEVHS